MVKTNIDRLIDAACAIYFERYSSSEGDIIISALLENGFCYDGHNYSSYAEGLDLSECGKALEQYKEEMQIPLF